MGYRREHVQLDSMFFCMVWNSSLSAIILLSFLLLDLSSFSACRTSLSLSELLLQPGAKSDVGLPENVQD
eukprot:1145070-Pelagomonas_calceolata.AAC.5